MFVQILSHRGESEGAWSRSWVDRVREFNVRSADRDILRLRTSLMLHSNLQVETCRLCWYRQHRLH